MFDACRLTDRNLIKEVDRQFVQDTSGSTMCSVRNFLALLDSIFSF